MAVNLFQRDPTFVSRFHYSPSPCGASSCYSSVGFQSGALANTDEFAVHDDTNVIYDASSAPSYASGLISLEDPERVVLGAALRNAP